MPQRARLSDQTVIAATRIADEEYAALQRLAADRGLSTSALLAELIRNYLTANPKEG